MRTAKPVKASQLLAASANKKRVSLAVAEQSRMDRNFTEVFWNLASPDNTEVRDTPTEKLFVFPMAPIMTNGFLAYAHRMTKVRFHKRYLAHLDRLHGNDLFPQVPSQPWERVELETVLYLGAAMDDDNAGARVKWAIDWLVTAGYLAGDTKKHIVRHSYPEQIVERGQIYRMALLLKRLD